MTPLLAVSDAVWLAIIGVATIAMKEYFDRLRANDAAKKAEEVKADLDNASKKTSEKLEDVAENVTEAKIDAKDVAKVTNKKLDKLVQTGEMTHLLVNSALGRTLRLAADALRAKANLTKDPADIRAAEIAEMESKRHDARQAEVDKMTEDGSDEEAKA